MDDICQQKKARIFFIHHSPLVLSVAVLHQQQCHPKDNKPYPYEGVRIVIVIVPHLYLHFPFDPEQ